MKENVVEEYQSLFINHFAQIEAQTFDILIYRSRCWYSLSEETLKQSIHQEYIPLLVLVSSPP